MTLKKRVEKLEEVKAVNSPSGVVVIYDPQEGPPPPVEDTKITTVVYLPVKEKTQEDT